MQIRSDLKRTRHRASALLALAALAAAAAPLHAAEPPVVPVAQTPPIAAAPDAGARPKDSATKDTAPASAAKATAPASAAKGTTTGKEPANPADPGVQATGAPAKPTDAARPSPQHFEPTEKTRADFEVSFPSDI